MTGVPAAAEDVAQDVFLAVIHDGARYSAGAIRRAWRGCSGLPGTMPGGGSRRDRGTSRCRPAAAEPGRWPSRSIRSPARPRPARSTRVRRALGTLPVAYREAVVLCDLQELTYQEAADAAGCAIGTVRSRLHRGRRSWARK